MNPTRAAMEKELDQALPDDLQEGLDRFAVACVVLRSHSLMPCAFLGMTRAETEANIFEAAHKVMEETS